GLKPAWQETAAGLVAQAGFNPQTATHAYPVLGGPCVAGWGVKPASLPRRAGETFGKRQAARRGKTKPRWGGSLVGAGGQQRHAGHDGGYSREPGHVHPPHCSGKVEVANPIVGHRLSPSPWRAPDLWQSSGLPANWLEDR